jgi:hypothetical protein
MLPRWPAHAVAAAFVARYCRAVAHTAITCAANAGARRHTATP